MKRPNITPGPWKESLATISAVSHGRWFKVAKADCRELTDAGNYANARAIAAVPELLAALEALVRESGRSMDDLDSDVSSHRPLIAAYEALTKAGYEFP